jgi:hypothetical protein
MRQIICSFVAAAAAVSALLASPEQAPAFMPIDAVKAGMVGTGRTVFAGLELEEFQATVIGVLRNVLGPGRDLILARLSGGPLANTGVIQGMSGSPVYIDGRLVGAVSYSLGTFPKEPLAGITPIAEMTADVRSTTPRVNGAGLAIDWPAPREAVFAALAHVASRAISPLGAAHPDLRVDGPQSLADLAPVLRPIGASIVVRGFEPSLDRQLRQALASGSVDAQSASGAPRAMVSAAPLRAGDPVGMSLMRGDLEMGATGTVTHVDGSRVYAFGHPFLNLGPASLAMTRAYVHTVLPSLSSSMKIASLGPVIGTITQDRATAVGGLLGAGPREMDVELTLSSDQAPSHTFNFHVLHDTSLTPLFSYVALLNSLAAYERQTGVMSIRAKGSISFGGPDTVTIDDVFSGEGAAAAAAGALATPIGAVITNPFRAVMPERMTVSLHVSEEQKSSTIERAWLDTTRPELGGSYRVQVQLKDYRGGTRVIAVPVVMPAQVQGPVKLLISDAATLTTLEQRELDPGRPTSWAGVIERLNDVKRHNTIYVRLTTGSPGSVVGGDTLPALPASVLSALGSDSSVGRAPVTRTVVGSWEHRDTVAVVGSREITLTLRPRP